MTISVNISCMFFSNTFYIKYEEFYEGSTPEQLYFLCESKVNANKTRAFDTHYRCTGSIYLDLKALKWHSDWGVAWLCPSWDKLQHPCVNSKMFTCVKIQSSTRMALVSISKFYLFWTARSLLFLGLNTNTCNKDGELEQWSYVQLLLLWLLKPTVMKMVCLVFYIFFNSIFLWMEDIGKII